MCKLLCFSGEQANLKPVRALNYFAFLICPKICDKFFIWQTNNSTLRSQQQFAALRFANSQTYSTFRLTVSCQLMHSTGRLRRESQRPWQCGRAYLRSADRVCGQWSSFDLIISICLSLALYVCVSLSLSFCWLGQVSFQGSAILPPSQSADHVRGRFSSWSRQRTRRTCIRLKPFSS